MLASTPPLAVWKGIPNQTRARLKAFPKFALGRARKWSRGPRDARYRGIVVVLGISLGHETKIATWDDNSCHMSSDAISTLLSYGIICSEWFRML